MDIAADINLIVLIGLVIIALLSWFVWDKRYGRGHTSHIPAGFEATDEVSLDPVDGKKLRVYYNPRTGERLYREED